MDEKIKKLWAPGQTAICSWMLLPDTITAEITANQGYDVATVDMQHGLIGYQQALAMLQAMSGTSLVPFARVPWLDPAIIMKLLDAGFLGIICPMINNAEQARELASYMRYPPLGERSFGPARAGFVIDPAYGEKANDMVQCMAMIETAEGYQNLEEIVRVDGINGIYIGPMDLTLGLFGDKFPIGADREEPEMLEVINRIYEVTRDAGKKIGIHCGTPEYAARMANKGFDIVSISSDLGIFSGASKATLERARMLMSEEGEEAEPSAKSGGSLY